MNIHKYFYYYYKKVLAISMKLMKGLSIFVGCWGFDMLKSRTKNIKLDAMLHHPSIFSTLSEII